MFLSIICQKGGVGKTTLSVNISHIFAKKGKKTLLIDLDQQLNSTTNLTNNKDKKALISLDLLSTRDPEDPENIEEAKNILSEYQSQLYIGYSLGSLWLLKYQCYLPQNFYYY